MSTPSVLIAGAGPSGLILAAILLENGIHVRIIDKVPQHRNGSRGAGVQPRTVELYDILGVLPEFAKIAEYLPAIAHYEPRATTPFRTSNMTEWVEPTPSVPHPNLLSAPQDVHEEVLRAHLAKLGASVELSTELCSFEQLPDHVLAHLVKTDASGKRHEEAAKFDYVVGTDGARSVVRKQLNLAFPGHPLLEQAFAIGDIDVEEGVEPGIWHMWNNAPKLVYLRSSGAKSKSFMFICLRPAHLADKLITREEFIDEFYDVSDRRDIKFGAMTWVSNYRPSARLVEKMRVGRVFLAGDAAHCHSFTGGQGLNSSVQDVINLGWKLALVQKGLAPDALLDTYGEERLRVIRQMLETTSELLSKTMDQVSGSKATLDNNAWRRDGSLSMLGVNYRGSSIVLEREGADGADGDAAAYAPNSGGRVRAAYRAPDAPGLFRADGTPTRLFELFRGMSAHTVLLFGGDAAARAPAVGALQRLPNGAVRAVLVLPPGETAADRMSFTEVVDDSAGHAFAGYGVAAGAGQLTVVVVRPDAVVGAVVEDNHAEGVKRYFEKIFV